MAQQVREALAEFEARATFFLCSDFVAGHEGALEALLLDGHEVANHCRADRSYADDAQEDFESALLEAEGVCESLRARARPQQGAGGAGEAAAPRWFRAPHGSLSPAMRHVLNRHGFTHVLTDCYANDPWISDPEFIAEVMLSRVMGGSVAVIHIGGGKQGLPRAQPPRPPRLPLRAPTARLPGRHPERAAPGRVERRASSLPAARRQGAARERLGGGLAVHAAHRDRPAGEDGQRRQHLEGLVPQGLLECRQRGGAPPPPGHDVPRDRVLLSRRTLACADASP
ncbi:unnamed protein product [Prorocentrum cordatum]|uniref:NodB homology domain-containing protein n=1 Tax=Prorocentrum cordatum TaxID=2364126 RepID=A0ABN9TNT8_9DINO|nr:unnamed protein product [Polarella glacialis]